MIEPKAAIERAEHLSRLANTVAQRPPEPDYYGEFNNAALAIRQLAAQLAAAKAEAVKWEKCVDESVRQNITLSNENKKLQEQLAAANKEIERLRNDNEELRKIGFSATII